MPTPQGAVDPDVKVPAAVQRAAARADAAFHAAKGTKPEGEKKPDGNTAEPTIGEPVVVTPQGNGVQSVQVSDTQPAPPVAQPPTPSPQRTPEEWEHHYRSLEGRYKAEQDAARRLSNEVHNLQRVIATMQMAHPQTEQPPPPELQARRLITPEEEKEYGPEFLDVVKRAAKELYEPLVADLRQQVSTLQSQVGQTAQVFEQDAKSKLFQTLDGNLPNWRVINKSPEFLRWLRLPDEYSGAIRHSLLDQAMARHDAGRVLRFFQGFLAEEAAKAPPSGGSPTPAAPPPLGNGAAGKVDLMALAAPGRARTAAADAPAEKPIIAPAQITRFYADVAAGKYDGNKAEKDRLENMIFEAQRDGRIR